MESDDTEKGQLGSVENSREMAHQDSADERWVGSVVQCLRFHICHLSMALYLVAADATTREDHVGEWDEPRCIVSS